MNNIEHHLCLSWARLFNRQHKTAMPTFLTKYVEVKHSTAVMTSLLSINFTIAATHLITGIVCYSPFTKRTYIDNYNKT